MTLSPHSGIGFVDASSTNVPACTLAFGLRSSTGSRNLSFLKDLNFFRLSSLTLYSIGRVQELIPTKNISRRRNLSQFE